MNDRSGHYPIGFDDDDQDPPDPGIPETRGPDKEPDTKDRDTFTRTASGWLTERIISRLSYLGLLILFVGDEGMDAGWDFGFLFLATGLVLMWAGLIWKDRNE